MFALLHGGRNSSVAINIFVYTFSNMQITPSGILCFIVLKLSSVVDKGMQNRVIYGGFYRWLSYIKLMGRLSKRIPTGIVILVRNVKSLLRHCLSISKDCSHISSLMFMFSSPVEVGERKENLKYMLLTPETLGRVA